MNQAIDDIIKKLMESDGDIDSLTDEELTLTIKIEGEGFHSSITGEVARSLWGLQENLYRAAALIIHGQPNIRKLTQEERTGLTLTFKIKEGCTDARVGLREIVKQLFMGFRDMESSDKRRVFKTAIVCALIGFTAYEIKDGLNNYFSNVTAQNASQALVEQAKTFASPLEKALEMSAKEVAKSTKNADKVSFGHNYTFDRGQIEELNTKSERQPASNETYESSFKVVGLEINGGRYKIGLTDDADPKEETFYVLLPNDDLFSDNLPKSPEEIAALIDKPNKAVRATILIRETKTKIDRILISWEPYDRN